MKEWSEMMMRRHGEGFWVRLTLLWLAGNSLRLTVLAVPPLLPAIHHSLRLSETAVGVLTSVPVLLLAAAAVPGSLLVARVGARRALLFGMVLIAVAGAVRGVGATAAVLFPMTFLMGLGIALSQPAMPTLVRQWFPARSGFATAVYSNGFLVGEIIPAALTIPLILPLLAGRWPPALALWSLPVVVTIIGVALLTPHVQRDAAAPPARWWPDWRSSRTWRLGLIMGGASISYWGANAFVPDYLRAIHHAGLVSAALTSVNICQLPASFIVALGANRVVAHRWPIMMVGVLTLISVIGLVALPGGGLIFWVGLLGFSSALVFILSLALPPLLSEPGDVHRLSAAMFTISYSCPFLASIVGGAIWDHTGVPGTAFAPVVVAAGLMFLLPLGLDFHATPGTRRRPDAVVDDGVVAIGGE